MKLSNNIAFGIDLPPTYILHPIIYIGALRKFNKPVSIAQTTLPAPILVGGGARYIIEDSISHRTCSS